MSDVFDRIGQEIDHAAKCGYELHPFYHFEPWDVKQRSDEVIATAMKDGVDLRAEGFVKHVGLDPHPFQNGYLASKKFFRVMIAGTSLGKSYVPLMEIIIMLSGELPIALRYDAGVDTGVLRVISKENILRWGRRDKKSGIIIDFNPDAKRNKEWDCGTIVGVGKYDTSKILPEGSKIWLGTYMKALHEYWWPRFAEAGTSLVPDNLIDRSKGVMGLEKKDWVVNFVRNCKLVCITYESGYNRFEAERVGAIVLDEEPDDERVLSAAMQRAPLVSLIETPYRGITYTRDRIFPAAHNADLDVFHACQYDSPYQSKELIEKRKKSMPAHEVGARVWGIHSEIRGRPFYDRVKIVGWLQKFRQESEMVRFVPKAEYYGVSHEIPAIGKPCLMRVGIDRRPATELDRKTVWKIYEDRQPGVPYFIAVDPAEGAENPDDAADNSCAMIGRLNDEGEVRVAASLCSGTTLDNFGRSCLYAMRYYNNCLLCSETKRGASNATLAMEMREWPYWYRMTVISDATNKPKNINGFDTNASTRDSIFKLIESWIQEHDPDEMPPVLDEHLMKELAACIVGRKGRPDHSRRGSLDMAVCFGILLYVAKNSKDQIVLNASYESETSKKRPFDRISKLVGTVEPSKPIYLGSGIPNWR